jgi:outer membrane lipoprotein SlyB
MQTQSTRNSRFLALVRSVMFASLVASMLAVAVPATAASCRNCGTVVDVNRNDQKGSSTAGTVVGGVGGAVAGNVIGHNTTSTILGGVGGAVAGNLIEKKITRKKIWTVSVKMDRGGTRNVDMTTDPQFQGGERVRIVNGALQRL